MNERLRGGFFLLVIAFVVYTVVKSPAQAADIANHGWNGLIEAGQAIGRFFNALLGNA